MPLVVLTCRHVDASTVADHNHGDNGDNEALPRLDSPRLSVRFASLSLMWDEWHGTGGHATKDKPVPGGFATLDEKYKTQWRKHLKGAQLRHFTRIRLVINGITKMAAATNVAIESLLLQLEPEWSRLKRSPDAMVKYLQEMGHLRKSKPRGKNHVTSQEQN